NSFDKIYIDGILLVNILNFFRFQIKRKSFDTTSLATTIFENVSNTQKSIYFIGSEEVHINKFIKTISSNFPKMKISGYRNGFFNSEEEKIETIKNIINLKPDVIVVGMGTPYQENFMLKLKANSFKGAAYSCGGFIHQTTEKINYYPKVFDKLNLRWLYRMIDEPKLIKRYFMYYPISILYFTVNLIKYKYSNK
ncbi:MAG: WecB/TagA/CpsF family glycosyltransferase, partial [Flavobacteriaceae bacterium]|nr:WecB/TagA/CpsF family glycosyltransferase [Flavobacteriaceae bacterium]